MNAADEALRLAAKAAIDAGDVARAVAILALLEAPAKQTRSKPEAGASKVVDLEARRASGERKR